MNPKSYLEYLQKQAYYSDYYIHIDALNPKVDKTKELIQEMKSAILDESPIESSLKELAEMNNLPPWRRLDSLADSIHSRASSLIKKSEYKKKLEKTVVGFLPTGVVNACCIGGVSNGYVVGVNFGLFYVSNLIIAAIQAPSTRGELLQDVLESVAPDSILDISIKCLVEPNKENYEELFMHYRFVPPGLLSMTSVLSQWILDFVFLHELGHICKNHVDEGSALAFLNFKNKKIKYINANHYKEYEADKFALEALLSNTTKPFLAWGAFSKVEVFFQFLMHVERSQKIKSSNTHPPAISRLRRLRNIMIDKWGNDEMGYSKAVAVRMKHMAKDLYS